jgi:hypothetical protein
MKIKIISLIMLSALLVVALVTVAFAADGNTAKGAETVNADGTVTTPYGTIPAEYANAADYPISVFMNGTFKGATAVFAEGNGGAFQTAKTLMDNDSEKDNVVQFFMRGDVKVTARHSNTGQMSGHLIIDLNGHTLSNPSYVMFAAQAKKYNKVFPLTITVTNGNISMKNAGLLRNSAYGDAYADLTSEVKTMTFVFDKINFSFTSGSTLAAFLGDFKEDIKTGKKAINVAKFKDCVFDMRNAKQNITMFNANDPDLTGVNNELHVTVEGGSFIFNSAADVVWYTVNTTNGSTFEFARGSDGKYPSLTVNAGTSVPETDLPLAGGETGTFDAESETGSTVTYRLADFTFGSLGFVPMSSITADSDLKLNVYLPSTYIKTFTLDGREYRDLSAVEKRTVNGTEYYFVSVPLSASEAARRVPFTVSLAAKGKEINGSSYFSVPRYAKLVMDREESTGNEKVLVADVLSYIKAAYEYFNVTDADAIAELDKVLDRDHGILSPVGDVASDAIATPGLAKATFELKDTPAFRFYLAEGYDAASFTFKQGNTVLNYTTGEDGDGKYVSVSLPAHNIYSGISYTVNGESGYYHIASYYEFSKTEGDAKLVSLVERFIKYCKAASVYRSEKLGDTSVAHTHSYLDRHFDLSAESREYDERVCACGDSIKDYKTGIDNGDEVLNIYFIGNSYTYYNQMTSIFASIASVQGIRVNVTQITTGGWHLYKYMNPNDSSGTKVHETFKNQDFDYVFLQDGSTQVLASIGQFYDGVRGCGKLAEDDGAQVILYQTWGRKEGHAALEQYGVTPETMALKVAAAYEAIARETGYALSPAGSAFLDVYKNHPEIELYDADLTHPSPAGSYLVALCHYATLFGRSPIGCGYDYDLDAETALILQTAAHNAVYGDSIVTDEYKTSSEGIGVVKSENQLDAVPEGSTLISVGITGDNGSTAYGDKIAQGAEMTDAQKKAFADISYGVSIIGAKNMINGLGVANNEVWRSAGTNRLSFDFDGNMYDITGDVDPNESYRALITYNFGKVVNITAIGYMSGNLDGFAQAQDVYISNDGITWVAISSASYDAVALKAGGGSLTTASPFPADKNGNTPPTFVLFDMNSAEGGVYAKYVRVAIKTGITVENKTYDINTLELAVYGKDYNSYLSAAPEGSELISKGLTSYSGYNTAGLTAEDKAELADMSKYGLTAIGLATLDRAIGYANNGVWGDKNRFSATFDDNKYDIKGNVSESGEFDALITYDFGKTVSVDAIGYMSGDLNGFPQNQRVYISNDGVNWIEVGTAAFNRAGGDTIAGCTTKLADSNGKTSGQCVLFDMGGVSARYVRIGVINGMADTYALDINTLEVVVLGKKS